MTLVLTDRKNVQVWGQHGAQARSRGGAALHYRCACFELSLFDCYLTFTRVQADGSAGSVLGERRAVSAAAILWHFTGMCVCVLCGVFFEHACYFHGCLAAVHKHSFVILLFPTRKKSFWHMSSGEGVLILCVCMCSPRSRNPTAWTSITGLPVVVTIRMAGRPKSASSSQGRDLSAWDSLSWMPSRQAMWSSTRCSSSRPTPLPVCGTIWSRSFTSTRAVAIPETAWLHTWVWMMSPYMLLAWSASANLKLWRHFCAPSWQKPISLLIRHRTIPSSWSASISWSPSSRILKAMIGLPLPSVRDWRKRVNIYAQSTHDSYTCIHAYMHTFALTHTHTHTYSHTFIHARNTHKHVCQRG